MAKPLLIVAYSLALSLKVVLTQYANMRSIYSTTHNTDRFAMDYRPPTSASALQLCAHTNPGDACYSYDTGASSDWNDHWSGFYEDGTWQKDGIAWKTDVESKFKYVELNTAKQTNIGPRQEQSGLNLPRADDEDFIVWMRAAALPHFRKLHRVIHDVTLPKDSQVTVHISSWFPTKDFGGEKWVTIAKTEWCGGANHALAWTYIVVACVAIGLTVTFAILLLFGTRYVVFCDYPCKPVFLFLFRKMADVNRFEWHNRPTNSALVSIS